MFNDYSSPIQYLLTRRSAKPRELIAPGPDDAQLAQMLEAAARTPDHGKLFPWRFVIIRSEDREAFAQLLKRAYLADKADAGRLELESIDQFARQAPSLVALISGPKRDSHIPVWEQELSAGAVAMNLLHAANASGFAGGWLTTWPTYNAPVRDALGGGPDDKIAGFFFFGTPSKPLSERPRPDMTDITSVWQP